MWKKWREDERLAICVIALIYVQTDERNVDK
jgi:hypothetical protein